jgi:hypothetical protein
MGNTSMDTKFSKDRWILGILAVVVKKRDPARVVPEGIRRVSASRYPCE